MTARDRRRAAGLVAFTVLCLLGSWIIAATLRVFDVNLAQRRLGTQLFNLSMYYIATMGWQPVVATWFVRRYVDDHADDLALRPARARFSVVGAATAVLCAALSAALAVAAARVGLTEPSTVNGVAESTRDDAVSSAGTALVTALGAIVALVLVWMQAVAEEIGWRGYVLPVSMRLMGRWRGLIFQGVLWGAWYAPVVFFSTFGRDVGVASVGRCLAFAFSCALLGILLGWLRLASGSIAPAVTANVTLTLVAGLPYVVHGIDAGLRSAIFRPVGWLVLIAILCALLASRWREVVQLPPERDPEKRSVLLAHLLIRRRDRTLN